MAETKGENVKESTKTQFHSWGRTILSVVGLVFAGGMAYQTIDTNREGIKQGAVERQTICEKVEAVKEDIHDIELSQRDLARIAETSRDAFLEIKKNMNQMNGTLNELKSSNQVVKSEMGHIKDKVNNLERAE